MKESTEANETGSGIDADGHQCGSVRLDCGIGNMAILLALSVVSAISLLLLLVACKQRARRKRNPIVTSQEHAMLAAMEKGTVTANQTGGDDCAV